MHLIDRYLPESHYSNRYSIYCTCSRPSAYEEMLHTNLTGSKLIRFLFKLRGMAGTPLSISDLERFGFIKLGETVQQEIVYGIATHSPTFSHCIHLNSPEDFTGLHADVIKSVINFRIEPAQQGCMISTETRVWCGSKKLRKKFRLYWFIIKPFSGLIRKTMLKQVRRQVQ
jgi:hypothetical protein